MRAVVAYFRVLYEYFLGGTEKTRKKLWLDYCVQAKESKLGSNNNEAPYYNIW